MDYVTHYRCTLCGHTLPKDTKALTCPKCGEKGILDIHYDYERLRPLLTKAWFQNNEDRSMWRYLPLMSVKASEATKRTLNVGFTPLYRSNRLEEALGLKALYFKDENVNPTGSLKDRASAVAIMKAIEEGRDTVACSSTGNAASSLAGNAARMGLRSVIFVPQRAPKGKLTQIMAYGATLIRVKGDYKAAYALSKKAIDHYGFYNRNAAINPHMVEGKKTVALEIAEQLDFKPTDWVVVSVGDGCTIGGVYNGLKDLYELNLIDRIPKILGVQSKGCAPFYDAWKENRKTLEEASEDTLADSIAVGIPRNPTKGLRAVVASKGAFITVSDDAILQAIKTLGSEEGLFCEPAAAASYAGLDKAMKQSVIHPDETASVILTGNGLKDPDAIKEVMKPPGELENDLDSLHEYLNAIGGYTHE
ncbi:MAG: threonine synthase [Bacillota bacterium]